MLLLGTKGSGKTSLAKIVGNALEENRFVLAGKELIFLASKNTMNIMG